MKPFRISWSNLDECNKCKAVTYATCGENREYSHRLVNIKITELRRFKHPSYKINGCAECGVGVTYVF